MSDDDIIRHVHRNIARPILAFEPEVGRKGDWMQTFTGKQFWPIDPRPDEVDIRDIAHALAHQCRYGGHVKRYYSVAEHSVLMCRAAPPPLKKAALMHDASEAYLIDIPRPVKKSLSGYAEIEERLMKVIARVFGFAWPLPPEVKVLDNRILLDEREALMSRAGGDDWFIDADPKAEPLGVEIIGLSPIAAEWAFRREYIEVFLK